MLRNFFVVLFAVWSGVASAATLVHEFTFDAGTANDSVGSLTGTLFGDASVSGGLLHLDGSGDYVELDGYALPSDDRDYSIRIRAQQTGRTSGAYMELISQGVSNGPGMYVGHDPSGNVRVGDALIGEAGGASVPYPNDGLFHEFILSSSLVGGTSLYIDGIEVFTSTNYADVGVGAEFTRFGRQYDPFSEYFTGKIDYIGIYDGLLVPVSGEVPLPAAAMLFPFSLLAFGLFRRRNS